MRRPTRRRKRNAVYSARSWEHQLPGFHLFSNGTTYYKDGQVDVRVRAIHFQMDGKASLVRLFGSACPNCSTPAQSHALLSRT
mmetsp:Transcript_57525/g.186716  ORF Transcript_57525/g.186716 Transcript_57525/m.186716 type:complete len:83 (+) Transcript_57525:732-980(+)